MPPKSAILCSVYSSVDNPFRGSASENAQAANKHPRIGNCDFHLSIVCGLKIIYFSRISKR